ncbi:MAG: DNA-binding protein WhiA [Clostridia bacterium]|nr:DNA-binding protein WhiA [Clostridia bacterium]
MSFSSQTKYELCKIQNKNDNILRAELYGYLLFAKSFKKKSIIFSTESIDSARRFCSNLSSQIGVITEMQSTQTNKKSGANLYTVTIPYNDDIDKIFDYVMHTGEEITLRINKAVLDDAESVCAFLRGVFLCAGSISDPEKEYHLEFVTPYKNLMLDLCNIIQYQSNEISDIKITPRTIVRRGSYIVYFKDKDAIAEMLAIMGASNSNIEFLQTVIQKDIINKINRRTNSEIANINKTAKAAATHLTAIQKIKDNNLFNSLSDELKEIANLRFENPEMSLRELGENLSCPISRSGVNHRLTKIVAIADSIEI